MKITAALLLLVAICHVAEVNSSRSQPKKEGEENPTVKRTLLDPGYGLEGALYGKAILQPGVGYGDPHHHHYGGHPHVGKISDVLTGYNPHLTHAAIASHLYSPLSAYHHPRFEYAVLPGHHGYSHHDSSDDSDRDSSGEERESERPKSEKSSKKPKTKKSKRPSSKSSSRSEKNDEKHHYNHHEHDEHKYPHLDYSHLHYPHDLLYSHHHLYPHLRAGLHYPYYQHPYYQPHLGLGHHAYNPYLQPVQYVQQSVEQQVLPGVQYTQDVQQQQVQQVQQVQQQQPQQQQAVQPDPNLQAAAIQQNPQAQGAVSYASFSQSLPQTYQPQVPQSFVQGQLYQPQLQVLQPQPFQLLGLQPVNFVPQSPQAFVPTPAPQQSLQSQPPNLFPESSQPVTQATLLQPIPTQPTIQTTSLVSSASEIQPVYTSQSTTPASTTTQQVVEIQPTKAPLADNKPEADNSVRSSRAYLTPLFSQTQEVVIQDPQLPLVSTLAPAYYGK